MKRAYEATSPLAHLREAPRRSFFRRSGALAGGVVTGTTLTALSARMALAHDEGGGRGHDLRRRRGRAASYGELAPTPDQDGQRILALPKDFQYVTFSRTGELFGDGLRVPSRHDGMAAFEGHGHLVRLIRNHEVTAINAPFPVQGPEALKYDPRGPGGCMTLDFDTQHKRLVRQFVSIAGTVNNCSGGWSKGNTGWMTCEENVSGAAQGYLQPHGYVYFVPAAADAAVVSAPMKAMGRFSHEGAVSDSRGIVYLTEDSGNTSGLYRFIPNDADRPLAGGVLQMLGILGNATATLIAGQTVGLRLPVHWVTIPVPDPADVSGGGRVSAQGRSGGAAWFNRLEGVFRGEDGRSMYFVSTSGGTVKGPDGDGFGQLWHYVPDEHGQGGELVLVFESSTDKVLESPDNICITPAGGILFCEDDAVGGTPQDTHPLASGIGGVNRMVGLGAMGEPFEFAVNIVSDSEFAGACFSPDGEVLFVNIQGEDQAGTGMSIAIWGPWERGPL